MLKLQEFIFNNIENWEELLSKAPYFIKIKKDEDFIIFNYNQVESDFNNDIVRECRGIILNSNTFDIMCHPFNKFGNYGESYVNLDKFDTNSLLVSEKIDGSLIKLWNYNNKWNVSTNGMIDAQDAQTGSIICNTYYDLFLIALNNNGFSFGEFTNLLCEDFTYMFELVSPYSQVVIPYDTTDIYFIGCRNNKTDVEINFNTNNLLPSIIKRPKIFDIKSIKDVIKASESLPWDKEGYVVCDKCFNRCKIKSPLYVAAHYARTNGNVSLSSLIKIVLDNETEEFLIYADDYAESINNIKTFMTYIDTLATSYLNMNEYFIKTDNKKHFVEQLNNSFIEHRKFILPFLYKNFDNYKLNNTFLSWKEYTKDWKDTHLNRWVDLYNDK